MTENNILTVSKLNFSIDGRQLLQDINLTAARKEFIGLIGPNGAGKSTLLRCINGINRSDGTISISGHSLSELNSRQVAKLVSYMPQETQIAFDFPAIDVVLAGRYPYLSWRKRLTGEDYEIARCCMEYTGTAQFADAPIHQVSGGERQRILFAKVLAQKTDLLLLDEPTSSLDISYQEDIFKYSSQLCREGKTIIMAVHDLKLAAQFCTRLILLEKGKIIADGPPHKVLTEENMVKAYGIQTRVFENRITGMLDLYSYDKAETSSRIKMHIIGGGGTAADVIRKSFERGYILSGGVFHEGDSDLDCARAFGIDTICCAPFTEIDEEAKEKNITKVMAADITVLCNIAVGRNNLKNLTAAGYAKTLVIIEDTAFKSRDYTQGMAENLYSKLKEKARMVTSAQFIALLDREKIMEE